MEHFAWLIALLLGLVLVFTGDHEEAEAASDSRAHNPRTLDSPQHDVYAVSNFNNADRSP